MSKKCNVSWSDIDGASPKPKRLHLEKDETDGLYHCPIQECDHNGFQSQRGCRKHVNTKHSWFFYFDEKPNSQEITDSLKVDRDVPMVDTIQDQSSETTKQAGKLNDFRKLHGTSEAVFRKFSATELYLKRARKTVAKMMRLHWTQDLDIETLEARGHWATM